MKLLEVLKPLFENKVDYITKNQGEKVAQRARQQQFGAADPRTLIQFMADNISKKYLQWVVNRYIAGDFSLSEDHIAIRDSLEIYHQMKSEIGIQLTNRVSTADLFEMVNSYRETMDVGTRKAKERELLANNEIAIPFSQDSNEIVIIPKTFEASQYLSKDNGWCTQYQNWYQKYTKDDQTLYYFRHNGEPHLVHWQSGQFMKKANRPFEVNQMYQASPAFQWIIDHHLDQISNKNINADADSMSMLYKLGKLDEKWATEIYATEDTTLRGLDLREYAFAILSNSPEWATDYVDKVSDGKITIPDRDTKYIDDIIMMWKDDVISDDLMNDVLDATYILDLAVESMFSPEHLLRAEDSLYYKLKVHKRLETLTNFIEFDNEHERELAKDLLVLEAHEHFTYDWSTVDFMIEYDDNETLMKLYNNIYDIIARACGAYGGYVRGIIYGEVGMHDDIESMYRFLNNPLGDANFTEELEESALEAIKECVPELNEIASQLAIAYVYAYERVAEQQAETALWDVLEKNGVLRITYDNNTEYALITKRLAKQLVKQEIGMIESVGEDIDLEKFEDPDDGWHNDVRVSISDMYEYFLH